MTPEIGISDEGRRAVAAILDRLLADEYVLYTKTRNFHWNVTGPQFNDLHKFFESQYEALDNIVDEVAERSRALGHRALGSLQEFGRARTLEESTGTVAARDMLQTLLSDHEAVARALRKDLVTAQETHGDAGTADFLTGLLEQHEKMAWMLRAFLTPA